jgi:hypothetical protein
VSWHSPLLEEQLLIKKKTAFEALSFNIKISTRILNCEGKFLLYHYKDLPSSALQCQLQVLSNSYHLYEEPLHVQ